MMVAHGITALLLSFGLGYFLGSIPFARLVAEWRKVDLRRLGSGNIGAANAFVVAGKLPGIVSLLGDACKGAAAVLLVRAIMPNYGPAVAAAAVGAVIGHDWPLYLHFKGGRGTATTIGVMLAVDWRVLVLGAAAYLVFFLATHYTVISSLVAVAVMPIAMVVAPYADAAVHPDPLPYAYGAAIIAGIGFLRHWDHVERFLQGREPKAVDMFREMKARGAEALHLED
ncbi:MAG: glycerol-3-phosphate acyltransferase [Chloroflexota bacterium]